MKRVENHKLEGVPLGVFIEGCLIVGTKKCNSPVCKEYYKNFDICGGNYGVTERGRTVCGFKPIEEQKLAPRWKLSRCEE